ncbi:MAG: N-acetyltransferase [Candidatus Latescibacteria bacterium]|nr:N-acetyltransferase [Candidatus Latescibacterota bacterium]
MDPVRYERAVISDFLPIAELDRNAWRQSRNSEFIPDGEHSWRLWVEHGLVFTARNADRLIGAILAFPCASGIWCVHKVFVDPALRGKGIGTRLFELLLQETDRQGVDCFLTVDPTNASALRLYERWGFVDRTFVKGYYRSNEDRYVLTRRAKK